MTWLAWVLCGAGVAVFSWVILILLASRLPLGLARDLAGFLPACATALRWLRRDARVPRRAKIAVGLATVWVLSPIDLIPEFLPVIGPLDDIVVVVLALRYAARQIPRELIEGAWTGSPRLLDRLLGSSSDSAEELGVEGDDDGGDAHGDGEHGGWHRLPLICH